MLYSTQPSYVRLHSFLGSFKLNEALLLIGRISYDLTHNPESPYRSFAHDGALAFIATELVLAASDGNETVMSESHLLEAIAMWVQLDEQLRVTDEKTWILWQGFTQFYYQTSPIHLLARTLLIYRELWRNNESARKFDVFGAIQSTLGLSIEEILLYGYFFLDQSPNGSIRQNDTSGRDKREAYVSGVSVSNQWRFFDWLRANYATIRASIASKPVLPGKEKYRANPLLRWPIIKPDIPVVHFEADMLIVPVPRLLSFAVSRGLSDLLYTKFKNRDKIGENTFSEAVGHVFEDYVQWLMLRQFTGDIRRAWRYQKSPTRATVDHVIIEDGRTGVLIEDKFSLIKPDLFATADMEVIQKAVSQNLARAVLQLFRLEQDIRSGSYERLKDLNGISNFEKLIVTNDYSVQLNGTLHDAVRNVLKAEHPEIPASFHWHVATIDELEFFYREEKLSLYEFLREKRLGKEMRADFDDYVVSALGKGVKNKHLTEVSQALLAEILLERNFQKNLSGRE